MRKRVYDSLRNAILEGRIPPGARLVETALAASIGVSRTPIREALHLLEREGLVQSIPRVGYRVRVIEWAEMEKICEIRIVNEILAAQWALDRLDEQQLSELEENVARCEMEIEAGNTDRIGEYDAAFHEVLVRAGGSERLLEICQNLRRHMVLFRAESFRRPETARLAAAGHRRIVERLRARDREGVARAIRTHLEDAKRFIAQHLAESDGEN